MCSVYPKNFRSHPQVEIPKQCHPNRYSLDVAEVNRKKNWERCVSVRGSGFYWGFILNANHAFSFQEVFCSLSRRIFSLSRPIFSLSRFCFILKLIWFLMKTYFVPYHDLLCSIFRVILSHIKIYLVPYQNLLCSISKFTLFFLYQNWFCSIKSYFILYYFTPYQDFDFVSTTKFP